MIPLVDLKAQYQSIKSEIRTAVDNVLESGQYVLGDEVQAFEEEFAAYCQSRYAVAVNSGTSALHLALLAAGVGPGDEVITVSFTFVATVAAVCYTGARPVFVDIDPQSFNIDARLIKSAITSRTKAILPVHLYGQMADMNPIIEIARRHGLIVIEDAAQAHGAEYEGRRAGSLGEMACFSFYPGKNLGSYGEGGIVTTSNHEYAQKIRMLRDWGQEGKYNHVLQGYNYRMEALQGAILRVKLRHLESWTEARRAIASRYAELLAGSAVGCPAAMPYARHVYHVYSLRAHNRERLRQSLNEQGIQTGIHYPIPAHRQKAYADVGRAATSLAQSEQAASEVISLPLYPEMTSEQIESVSKAVREIADVE